MYACVFICVFVCMYVCKYVCMYVCMYVSKYVCNAYMIEMDHVNVWVHSFIIVTVFLWLHFRLSVTLSLCLSICPAIKAYISVTMDWILMKLGKNFGTQVRSLKKICSVMTSLWRNSWFFGLQCKGRELTERLWPLQSALVFTIYYPVFWVRFLN